VADLKKASREMHYQTYLVSCWQEQDETNGKSSWRFRLEIPRNGQQHMMTTLKDVMAVIKTELQKNQEKNMNPEEIVKQAELAYGALDLDQIILLFDPQIIVYWNGQKIIEGLDELRKWHERWMETKVEGDHWVRKTLRAASSDTIAVEWEDHGLGDDGKYYHGYGGEFWKMRGGRLLEWRAYYHNYPINEN
jgi:nuclear transport factor 2 (NTF2) superfamily protein